MYALTQVTSDYVQKQTITVNGLTLTLVMEYKPMQYGWWIRDLSCGDFEVSSLRISVSPNMLHQFKNIISFGLACFTADGQEPTQLEDFSSGTAALYILTPEECAQLTEYYTGEAALG